MAHPAALDHQLRTLAPVLGWHTSDLFLAAGLRPPPDLAPSDRSADAPLTAVWLLAYLPQAGRRAAALLEAAAAEDPVAPPPDAAFVYDQWFAATILRLFGTSLPWPAALHPPHPPAPRGRRRRPA